MGPNTNHFQGLMIEPSKPIKQLEYPNKSHNTPRVHRPWDDTDLDRILFMAVHKSGWLFFSVRQPIEDPENRVALMVSRINKFIYPASEQQRDGNIRTRLRKAIGLPGDARTYTEVTAKDIKIMKISYGHLKKVTKGALLSNINRSLMYTFVMDTEAGVVPYYEYPVEDYLKEI